MPKPRRESTARADPRPAFNRPPGARASLAVDDGPRTPKRVPKERAKQSPAPSPEKKYGGNGGKRKVSTPVKPSPARDRVKYNSGTSSGTSSNVLSLDSLTKLNAYNEKRVFEEKAAEKKRNKKQYKELRGAPPAAQQRRKKKKNRDVSGAILEEGRWDEKRAQPRRRGGRGSVKEYVSKRHSEGGSNRTCWIILGIIALLLVIFIPVGVVLSKKKSTTSSATTTDTNSNPTNTCDGSDVPASAKGTYTDVTTWLDTTDFNCTYTSETVGGLSVMGLSSAWDDSPQANENVPAISDTWQYGQMPIRGVNLGGWLMLEYNIDPPFFNDNAPDDLFRTIWVRPSRVGKTTNP